MVETDAIAQAGADAGAYACDGDVATAEVDVIAQATATALAQAIGDAYVFCESIGDSALACGLTQVEVEAVAFAQVRICWCPSCQHLRRAFCEPAGKQTPANESCHVHRYTTVYVNVDVNVNNLLAISIQGFDTPVYDDTHYFSPSFLSKLQVSLCM